jgi:asparagine synthase (glutamine-hydrolysing)
MCGVFGWVRQGRPLTADEIGQARVATGRLAHRGPDGDADWHENAVFMGHRRLKIIDLSDNARQPFSSETGRYLLCYNGELYNYIELRTQLEARGHRFRTRSDTEVMLNSLIEWGTEALSRFDGMFAAAFHDRETGRHILFRDPTGQKPLYWSWGGQGLLYGSELRSLLALPHMGWRLDRDAFVRFLANGYYALTETPIHNVQKLAPGFLLDLRPGGAPELKRYWPSTSDPTGLEISDQDAIDRLETLLTNACRRTMRSDVPFGVFLSGGLDSSLVYATCQKIDPQVQAFTVGMAAPDFDESHKARAVHGSGNGTHVVAQLDEGTVLEVFDSLLGHSDEPHADPGFINASFIAKTCRPHITVGLSGDGGDELFAGYAPVHGLRYEKYIERLPPAALSLAKCVAAALPNSDGYLGFGFKARAYLQAFPADATQRFALWLSTLPPERLARLCPSSPDRFFDRYSDGLFGPVNDVMRKGKAGAPRLTQLLHFYQTVFLPEFVCMHTDRAGMQHGLEIRAPLLCQDIVTFANRLPERFKLRQRTDKWLLRALALRLGLPNEIATQRKQGFTFPIARWLKTSLRNRLDNLLGKEEWQDEQLVDWQTVEALRDAHLSGRENNYRILYGLMVFRAWRRRFPQVAI